VAVKSSRIFSRIKQQYKLAIGLIILSVSLTSVAALYVLYQQKEYAHYINLAGKQRMLSQKINLIAYQAVHHPLSSALPNNADLMQTLDKFRIGFQLLSQTSAIDILSEPRQIQVKNLYYSNVYSIEQTINTYTEEVRLFIENGHEIRFNYQVLFNPDALENLLQALDQVVTIYQQQAEQSVQNLETSILILWLFTLLVIGLEVIYIFKPTQQQIVRLFSLQEDSARQLVAAKEQAEHANSIKSQLLANISHEVRTPLNGVLGMLNIIKTQRRFEPDYIQKAERCAHDLVHILDFVLEFADLEQNKTKIQIKPCCFTQLASNLTMNWQKVSSEKGLAFDIHLAENVPVTLDCDAKAIESIVNNLCSNAVKFTEFGSVKLEFGLEQKSGSLVNLIICVQDTGIGMLDDAKQSLFDAFNQQSKGLSRKFEGCGIGLSIVKKLLKLLDGRIEIDSKLGQGTRVTVKLPVKLHPLLPAEPGMLPQNTNICLQLITQNPVLQHHYRILANHLGIALEVLDSIPFEPKQDLPCRGLVLFDLAMLKGFPELNPDQTWVLLNTNKQYPDKLTNSIPAFLNIQVLIQTIEGEVLTQSALSWPEKRVLVVEDNEINQEVIRNLLEQFKIEVEVANDGLEAVELIQQKYFDLVLMDLQMPNLDGISATQKIRSLSLNFQPPVVALTAHALRTDEQACYDAGMDDFLTKPINADNLFNVLRRFLTR